jgi:DNA polymerase-3 subunit delta
MPTAMKLTADELLNSLSSRRPAPCLLLLGEETYFQDQIIAALKKTILGNTNPEFSTFQYDLTEIPVEKALQAAATHSLLAPNKLVIVRELERLRETQIKESDESALRSYLEDPNPETILVILAEKLDGRRKIPLLIQKHSWTIDCSRLSTAEVIQWVDQQIHLAKKSIDSFAVRELVETVGNNLTLLEQEIQKILSYVGARDGITRDDVELLMFRARVNSVFDLVDAINRKDRAGSLIILNNLFENDIEATRVLFWLARLYRQLLTLKEQKSRLDSWGVVRLLRVPRDFAERLVKQEKKFTRDELLAGFHKFAAFEYALKNSSVDHRWRCEFFILELISGPPLPHPTGTPR